MARGETYGYVVAQNLQSAGLRAVKGGTLYPILNRLEADGLLTSSWREGVSGPGRKFSTITQVGREHLDRRAAAWQHFTERATSLLLDPRSNR